MSEFKAQYDDKKTKIPQIESVSAAGNRAILQLELKNKTFAEVIHDRCKAMNFNILK
jgi:hypothetical protein